MRNLVLNAIKDLENTNELLTKALDKLEYREMTTRIIEINSAKIEQLNKLLNCKFSDVIALYSAHYYKNDKDQFLTTEDKHYLILGYANVKFKIYIKDGIIKSVIPCYKNENLTMFERVHKKYSDYKRVNEQELLKFVLDHTCVQFEVIEE